MSQHNSPPASGSTPLLARLKALRQALADEAARHEQEHKRLKALLAALQRLCPHERTYYHADPSGNGDSYNECLDCGSFT